MIELHQGDGLEWMPQQPDGSVDFVLGSPPYEGKGKRYDGSDEAWKLADWVPWMRSMESLQEEEVAKLADRLDRVLR